MRGKNSYLLVYGLFVYGVYVWHLNEFLGKSLHSEYYSHAAYIPLLSACLFFIRKDGFPTGAAWFPVSGLPVIAAALALYLFLGKFGGPLQESVHLALLSLAAVILWSGGLIICHGTRALRLAATPFSVLIFMFPLPVAVMDKLILLLRIGSTGSADCLFRIAGVPYVRDGFIFYLPNLYVTVAEQCSGIHSTIALTVTGLFAALIFLDTPWKRVVLMLSIIPIAIFKNGFRIFVLSVLGVYNNEKILADGWLHKSGGFLFFIFALLLLWGVIRLLSMEGVIAKNAETHD